MSFRRDITDRAAGAWVFAILIAWSLLLAPLGWIIWLLHALTGASAFRKAARACGWFYGRSSLLLLWPLIRVRVVNPGAAAGKTPCIITANHQSILDLYLLGFQDVVQVCPMTKSWPFRLLLPFRPTMRTAGYVEAENRPFAEVQEECRARLAEGAALIVYPEGRRSRTGELGGFHAGAFRLAMSENLPIVPMVIKNSFDILPPETFRVRPGTVELEMLPAIMPAEYERFAGDPLPHRALMKHVRNMYVRSRNEFLSRQTSK